jgi:hypothetical protein
VIVRDSQIRTSVPVPLAFSYFLNREKDLKINEEVVFRLSCCTACSS